MNETLMAFSVILAASLIVSDVQKRLVLNWQLNALFCLATLYQCQFMTVSSILTMGLMGYASLWIPNTLYFLYAQHQGLGRGDMKLMSAITIWLGYQAIPIVLCFASLASLSYLLFARLATRRPISVPLPFVPPLLLSASLHFILAR